MEWRVGHYCVCVIVHVFVSDCACVCVCVSVKDHSRCSQLAVTQRA